MKLKKLKYLYCKNDFKRSLSSTYLSFTFNVCIGIGKLVLGVVLSSYWFIITAGYYLTLSISRGHLLHSYTRVKETSKDGTLLKQLAIYHRSGFFLIVLAVSYLGLCIWMYRFNQQISYPDYITYGVAAIAFYKIGNAIYGLFKTPNKHSPVFRAIKIMNMADACVSIVAVQCALLTQQHSLQASSSSALLGMFLSVLLIITGVYMTLIIPNSFETIKQ